MENVSRKSIGVMVFMWIAMMDQMKMLKSVVSKKLRIKSLHVYQSFFLSTNQKLRKNMVNI